MKEINKLSPGNLFPGFAFFSKNYEFLKSLFPVTFHDCHKEEVPIIPQPASEMNPDW